VHAATAKEKNRELGRPWSRPRDSTVSGNSAGTVDKVRDGGGIYNGSGALTLTNSTVSGNSAERDGGGIYNFGTVTLTNSTVSENTSGGYSGGIYNRGTATLTNTTVSGNRGRWGGSIYNGYNIESPSNTCRFGQEGDQANVTEVQLNLGELADNGGPTMTHALLPCSVAIDVIPEAACEVDTDQRGEPRPGGTMCDVGAFELEP
jgi:hypothetical protein